MTEAGSVDALVRPATTGDAANLILVIDEVSREGRFFLRDRFKHDPAVEAAFIELTNERGGIVLVAETEGELVGWLTLQREKTPYRRHVCRLGMGVLYRSRRRGIGRQLVQEALHFAQGCAQIERIELSVRATNLAAIALYQQTGFAYEGRRVGAVRDTTGHHDDEIIMAWIKEPDRLDSQVK